jgi:hypothetical protein
MQSAYDKANTGTTPSGYLANSVIIANSTGFLSNSNVFFTSSNNNLIVSGNVQVRNGSITTSAKELTLGVTGDTYGAQYLRLQNRNGLNGALFDGTSSSVALVDFGFKTTNGQKNIRFETRASNVYIPSGDGLEFQIGDPDDPTLVTSNNSVLIRKTTRSTSNTTGALVVTGGVGITGNLYSGNIVITGTTSNGITFADGTRQITAASGSGIDQWVRDTANVTIGVDASQNVRLDYSNTAITIIQGTDVSQNARMTIIEGVDATQNTNISNKVNLTGSLNQTISGNVTIGQDLVVTGNLILTGNVNSQNVQQLAVADPLILLGIGNYVSDTKDIGFAGHYNDGTNAHAGLIRDSGTKEFYVFQGYVPEADVDNNIIITDPTFRTANLNANYVKGNLIATTAVVSGIDLSSYTQATYAQANVTIGVDATQNTRLTVIENTDLSQNVRLDYSNTAINATDGKMQSAYTHANGAFIRANSAFDRANSQVGFARISVSGQPDALANIANAGLTFVAGSGMTITTVGTSNTITFASTGGGGGASLSGYLANTVVVANASGFLSNSNVFFTASNNTLATSNVYVSNRVGFANANNILVVYQVYNANTNSLDTIFG